MWPDATPPTAAAVRIAFGIDVRELCRHPGGFQADAFTDGRWFVKLFRFEPETDAALAVAGELAARGLPVPAAVRALDGSYTGEHDGRRYAVYPYVEGRSATWDELDAIARAMRSLHEVSGLVLPPTDFETWCIDVLRGKADHPWIAEWRDEIQAAVDRLVALMDSARAVDVPAGPCHHDLMPHNVLVSDEGRIVALLDWGSTMLAPREHDLFLALISPDPVRFMTAYGADGLDRTHLEYARLARSVRDIAARVDNEVEREWLGAVGIPGLRRVEADLDLVSLFLA
jgi:serine/threonine protein kinase